MVSGVRPLREDVRDVDPAPSQEEQHRQLMAKKKRSQSETAVGLVSSRLIVHISYTT